MQHSGNGPVKNMNLSNSVHLLKKSMIKPYICNYLQSWVSDAYFKTQLVSNSKCVWGLWNSQAYPSVLGTAEWVYRETP